MLNLTLKIYDSNSVYLFRLFYLYSAILYWQGSVDGAEQFCLKTWWSCYRLVDCLGGEGPKPHRPRYKTNTHINRPCLIWPVVTQQMIMYGTFFDRMYDRIDPEDHRLIIPRLSLVVLCLSITDEEGTDAGRTEDGWQQLRKLTERPFHRVRWSVTCWMDEERELEDASEIYVASLHPD